MTVDRLKRRHDMSTLNIPRFTAEASLYTLSGRYRMAQAPARARGVICPADYVDHNCYIKCHNACTNGCKADLVGSSLGQCLHACIKECNDECTRPGSPPPPPPPQPV